MDPWTSKAFMNVLVASGLACWLATWGSRRLAARWGVLARRNARRRHERDTPLLGGLGFYVVLVAATLVLLFTPGPDGAPFLTVRAALCFLGAITLVFGVGAIDDWKEIKAPPKLAAEVAAAVLILNSAPGLPPILSTMPLPEWASAAILVLWIVGITNAMNMIDGLDGLCAGMGAISAFTIAAISTAQGGAPGASVYLAIALAGCCLGFLLHNFHPARIFLGDSGSLLLGFVLAVVSVNLEVKRSLFVSLSMPIIMLGLPLIDVALSVIRRRRLARSIFQGDRSHIHHRLQQVGFGHKGTVVFLWLCGAYLNASAFFVAQLPLSQSIYVYATIVPTLVLWFSTLYFLERRLSYQAARFSHLFVKQEDFALRDRGRLAKFVRARVEEHERNGLPFTVVVLDGSHFMKEMAHERPYRVVAFYMNLYAILKSRLRDSDLVARVQEHRFVTLLAGAGGADGAELEVIGHLSDQVRELQETYHIFQSHPRRPEGFKVLRYPKDASRIWDALDLPPAEWKRAA
jgi:UDP-GlcNAc:undecaprenyl-phosphate GlcNAc-1-phosphate transferase